MRRIPKSRSQITPEWPGWEQRVCENPRVRTLHKLFTTRSPTPRPYRVATGKAFASTTHRSGLTLLELLISLGLGVLLIGSVGATLMIYLRTESTGRQRMQRAQIVRSLYLRMSEDLRDVTYLEELTTESEDTELTAAEETDQADIEAEFGSASDYEEFLTPPEALGTKTNGLYGDSTSFVIYIKRPKRLPPRIAAQETAEDDEFLSSSMTGSGLRCVSWYLNESSSVGAMVETIMPADNLSSGMTAPGGICRLDHDAQELLLSEDVYSLVSYNAQVLAPEVMEVLFRYYDGVDWVDEWDSALQERLPNAVEITFTFEEVDMSSNQVVFGDDPDGFGANTFRFVVALPMAPPPLTEVDL